MNDHLPNARPPIEWERSEHVDGDIVLQVSRAKLPVPRYTFKLGRMGKNGLSPYVSWERIDAAIAFLTKIRDERGAAIAEEIKKAVAERDAHQRRFRVRQHPEGHGDESFRHRKPEKSRIKTWKDVDLSAADRRSERARAEQAKLAARYTGARDE